MNKCATHRPLTHDAEANHMLGDPATSDGCHGYPLSTTSASTTTDANATLRVKQVVVGLAGIEPAIDRL